MPKMDMIEENKHDILIRSWTDFSKVYEIISKGDYIGEITLVLGMVELLPMEVLIISQFSIWLEKRASVLTLLVSPKLKKYVDSIGLTEFCNANIHSPSTLEIITSATAMPIKRVDREMMTSYILATEQYLKSLCPKKNLHMLQVCLSELINNVYDHSNSPIDAYVFCEYYEEKNSIVLVVSDLGVGIPSSVKTYRDKKGLSELSEGECVKWAIKENSTTQSLPRNLGKGLDTLNSFVAANNSTWQMLTGNVLMKSSPTRSAYFENPIIGFIGTIVELEIRVDNLEDLDETNENEMDW
jgi:anti-sigma regulatory factor (Ser/Thr protein kinase)